MSYYPRHHARPKFGRTLTLAALWLGISTMVAGFGGAVYMTMNQPVDAYALCQRSALEAAATTTILIDATDTFTEDQRRRTTTTIAAERERLPHGGRLILVSLNPDAPWEPTELIAVCNPGKAENANPLLVTRSKIEKHWHEAFADPIDQAMAKAIDQSTSPRSPIIVTLAAIMARADFDARVANRRLVIISDLLEHDKGVYSQIRGGDFWKSYAASTLPRTIRHDLHNVDVVIDYLQRGAFAGVQGPQHQAFWQRLLTEAGATQVSFLGLATANLRSQDDAASRNGRK